MSCKEKPPCISLYNNKDTQVLQGKTALHFSIQKNIQAVRRTTALHFPFGHCKAVKGAASRCQGG